MRDEKRQKEDGETRPFVALAESNFPDRKRSAVGEIRTGSRGIPSLFAAFAKEARADRAETDEERDTARFGNGGTGNGLKRDEREKMRHNGLLYRMYVSAEAAGKGIGRELVRETIRLARTQSGLEQINLTVIADNERAKSLHTSEGFVTFAREVRALKVGENGQNECLNEEQMALRFS